MTQLNLTSEFFNGQPISVPFTYRAMNRRMQKTDIVDQLNIDID